MDDYVYEKLEQFLFEFFGCMTRLVSLINSHKVNVLLYFITVKKYIFKCKKVLKVINSCDSSSYILLFT